MEGQDLIASHRSDTAAAGVSDARAPGGSAPFIWALGILAFLVYGCRARPLEDIWKGIYDGPATAQTLLWLICKYPLIVAPIAVVLLIVAGQLGGSLGLPGLFRNPPHVDLEHEKRRRQNKGYLHSRGGATAFWGAFGVTFLTGLVWTAVYFSETSENLDVLPGEHFRHAPNLMPLSWHAVGEFARDPGFWSHGELLWFLGLTCCPFLLLFLLAEVIPTGSVPGMDLRGWEFRREIFHFAGGMVAGVFVVIGLAKFGAVLHGPSLHVWTSLYPLVTDLPDPLVRSNRFSLLKIGGPGSDPPHRDAAITVIAVYTLFPVVVLLFYSLFAVALRRRLSPGLAICMLLSLLTLFFSMLAQLSTPGQIIALALLLIAFVCTNGGRFKHRFPGMDPYYEEGARVRLEDLAKAVNRPAEEVGLLRDQTALTSWHKATGQDLPKLVLIATTGGAYRASFWTTVVLDELNRHLGPDFHRHIRLITGASGGMVGAAYYVSALRQDGPPEGGVTERLREESGLDSLTPVVRQFIFGDLLGLFWPFPQRRDRGVELEQQWTTLDRTFPALSEGEKAGWRPSLVVSPMVVESGRRLLISNLDLSRLAETRPLEPALLRGRSGAEAEAARIYSRSAVEFFRIFPRARETFSLQTAVRMSATFPFASPAVSLPAEVSRRVVDAGYYDNYGVDLATSWIYVNQDWIREHTSGVALIQLRAYPSELEIQSFFGLPGEDRRHLFAKLQDRFVTSFQGLSSPLAGGLSAREWSMRFRNANQVRVLDDLLNRGRPTRLFETFVFENSTDFAMNWFLSDQDIAGMRRNIGADDDTPVSWANGQPGAKAGMAGPSPADPRSRLAQAAFREKNLENKERLARWWQNAPVATVPT